MKCILNTITSILSSQQLHTSDMTNFSAQNEQTPQAKITSLTEKNASRKWIHTCKEWRLMGLSWWLECTKLPLWDNSQLWRIHFPDLSVMSLLLHLILPSSLSQQFASWLWRFFGFTRVFSDLCCSVLLQHVCSKFCSLNFATFPILGPTQQLLSFFVPFYMSFIFINIDS